MLFTPGGFFTTPAVDYTSQSIICYILQVCRCIFPPTHWEGKSIGFPQAKDLGVGLENVGIQPETVRRLREGDAGLDRREGEEGLDRPLCLLQGASS